MSTELTEKIRDIEQRHARRRGRGAEKGGAEPLATGWAAVDAALGGGLLRGGLHEWLGIAEGGDEADRNVTLSARPTMRTAKQTDNSHWRPALSVAVHLAWRAVDASAAGERVVWVGRNCFPYPAALVRAASGDGRLLERSLFVAAVSAADRVWAVELALRCAALGMVVADGSGLDMPATRRVQLAAKNAGAAAILLRPAGERRVVSAAQTRWLVRAEPSEYDSYMALARPAWRVELLRCKGRRGESAAEAWRLEWDHDTGTLHSSAAMADQAGAAEVRAVGAACGVRSA